jgi:arylsulfatase A-like enzyme
LRHLAVHWQKSDLLEGGLRIPMVIAWPARIAPGRPQRPGGHHMGLAADPVGCRRRRAGPGYPPDGMNLLPALTGNAAAVDRKLFWRYKGKWQRAARIGDYKFLKILDNTFLFNVVEDPLERANRVLQLGYTRVALFVANEGHTAPSTGDALLD